MDIFCKLYKMYPKPLLNYRRDQHLRTPEYFILCTAFFLYDLITKMQISALFPNRNRRHFCYFYSEKVSIKNQKHAPIARKKKCDLICNNAT